MDSDYESTKRSIEGDYGDVEDEDGLYRPEGKSAEKGTKGLQIFRDMGLSSTRPRNVELARNLKTEAEELFEQAKQTSEAEERKKTFRKAAQTFEKAADNWQQSAFEQEALLMAGECLFFAEDYYQAEQTYAKLVKEYPRNPYLDGIDSRRFEIADYWLKTAQQAPKPSLRSISMMVGIHGTIPVGMASEPLSRFDWTIQLERSVMMLRCD